MPTFQTFSLFHSSPPAASYVSSDKRPAVASYFPKVRPHAPNTVQTPAREELSFIGRLKQTLWAIGDGMRDRKIKYAIKAGMATAILAAPAFFEVTRPIFVEYRGEWALISVRGSCCVYASCHCRLAAVIFP